jgi:hypothetical protein
MLMFFVGLAGLTAEAPAGLTKTQHAQTGYSGKPVKPPKVFLLLLPVTLISF